MTDEEKLRERARQDMINGMYRVMGNAYRKVELDDRDFVINEMLKIIHIIKPIIDNMK